jgi:periplasmic protein TonB
VEFYQPLKLSKMKRNDQKVPGFDEIIFENRNKSYGAFDIRRRYRSAASLSLLGGVTLFSIPFILVFIFDPAVVTAKSDTGINVIVRPDNFVPPDNIAPPEPVKPVKEPPQFKYIVPKVTDDTSGITKIMSNDYAVEFIKDEQVTENTDTLIYAPPVTDFQEEDEPLVFVEEPPAFPGGNQGLLKYIAEHTNYPLDALENNIQGRVYVKFVVAADGSVKRTEIIKGLHPSLDEEALRVISKLPAWKPGRQNGQPVSVWFQVPVTFQIIIR